VAHLVHAGVVTRRKIGNQVHYQANAASAIFFELKSLMIKTSGVSEPLRQALAPMADRIPLAFIYGSLAKGTETAKSDVDVMIVGEVTFSEVVGALGAAQEQLRREINPSVYPSREFVAKLSAGNHFLTALADEAKLFLLGDQDVFTRLVTKRMVD
jgi:uncharacterized protein